MNFVIFIANLLRMNADKIFSLANLTALCGWALLTILPRWRYTKMLVHAGLIPLMLSLLYLLLILLYFGQAEGGFGTLNGVMKLFENKYAVLTGWVHYLAFDLFVGAWEVSDSQKHSIHHLLIIPCLFLTFMLGPVGLLAYFIVRAVTTKKALHENF
jgi:hypothetical protein